MKSTLLLIPLFGVNYVVFVYLVEVDDASMEDYKILFDLGPGSFLVDMTSDPHSFTHSLTLSLCLPHSHIHTSYRVLCVFFRVLW